MTGNLEDFYARLTPFYHLLYPDWEKSIEKQAGALDAIIREVWGEGHKRILDAACGIGTQSLGLAVLGYLVAGSDLSPQAVARARVEAAARDLDIPFTVADMRALSNHHQDQFDIVLACDNALPHLLSDDEILEALRQFYACTRPGGGCIISVRDYESEDRAEETSKVYGLREENGARYLIFQVWDWRGEQYDLSLYFIADDGGDRAATQVMRAAYYAVGTGRLIELMAEAGFRDVKRLDGVYFQPVIVGTRGKTTGNAA